MAGTGSRLAPPAASGLYSVDRDDRMDRFESSIGELRGRMIALDSELSRLMERIDRLAVPEPDKHSGLKTAVTFASLVIVPILVAILGGYFALKTAGVR
jgi:hypothetical protein